MVIFINLTTFVCVTGLIGCDNPDTLEACLGSAEYLIRAQPDGLYEVWYNVRKYRESYCNLPGVGDCVSIGGGIAQMFRFLLKFL